MVTSFAFALLPLEIDDKAPPMDWRTREKMSQGYIMTSHSALLTRGHTSGLRNMSADHIHPSHVSRLNI